MYSLLLKSLHKITEKYLLEEKIIIVPSYLDGNTLINNLAYENFPLLNFRITTLFDLAREMCLSVLIKNGLSILNTSLGQVVIYQILKVLSSEEKLVYFQFPLITPQISKSIFRTIKEIRVSGYTSENWPYDKFSSSAKIKDLYQVMLNYEKELKNKNLLDEAELYLLAKRINLKEDKSIFLIPSNIKMNEVELQFFNKKIKSKAILLPFSCSEEMAIQQSFSLNDCNENLQSIEKRIFDFLYLREKVPANLPDLDVEFCQAYSESIEAREVLRTIVEKKIPYDQVQVFYTTPEPYSQYFYQLSNLYQIPISFHSGIQIKNSKPAKLLFSFLDWMNDQYNVSKLVLLLNSGNIHLELKEPLTIIGFSSLLRQSPIGWGRERYLPSIELAIRESQRKAKNTSESRNRKYFQEIQYYQIMKNWIKEIFSEIPPESQDKIPLSLLARGLSHIISKYTIIEKGKALDEEAYNIILEKMEMLERHAKVELPISEALSLINDLISGERIHASEPHAGTLHIASYKKGIWMNRPYTFIIGMDSNKFPGSSDEGTVFLDTEKKPFKQLRTNSENNLVQQFRLLQLILAAKKKTIISYPGFDTRDHREMAPASFLLQLYRLKEKNIEKNYQAFYNSLGGKRTLIPKNWADILDIGDLFLFLSKEKDKNLQKILFRRFPDLLSGIKAGQERKKEELNAYNGKIKVITERVDPRLNRGIILSSSKLERIAYCPYLYFLTDVLKIKPYKEMIYEPGKWMNPLDRGLLLHQIYEKFYKNLLKMSDCSYNPPSFIRHWPVLEKVVDECLEEKRKFLAPPNEMTYEAEKREIIESCQVFLTGEEENYKGEVPTFFELAFGTRDNTHEVLGRVKSIELILPEGGRISFQGKIDRVDQMTDHTLRIIDYKTGMSEDYKKGKPFRFGQQIQHALYAIALEKILEKKDSYSHLRVGLSGYYFPTVQGQGRLILYGPEHRIQVLQVIEILLNIVSQGNFPMIQKPDSLMCKDYLDIMEQNELFSVDGKKDELYQDKFAFDCMRRLRQFE